MAARPQAAEPATAVRPAVAVFVKTPGLSPVKTRLGRVLGRRRAERAYRLAAECVGRAIADSGLPGYWAVAEPDGMDDARWAGMPRLAQGAGSLGERMARVLAALRAQHGAGILVGADLPQIRAGELRVAARWLHGPGPAHVLGPARDGGFWLYGANVRRPAGAWAGVPYGAPDTARRFVRAMGHGRWKRMARRTDLDRAEDIPHVLQELRVLETPSPAQRRLADWLATLPE